MPAWDVVEAARKTDSPFLHGLANQPPHLLQLGRSRLPRIQADHFHAHVAVGDQAGHVDGTFSIEAGELFRDAGPPLAKRRVAAGSRRVAAHVIERGQRGGGHGDAILAEDVRRDALANSRFVVRIGQKHQIPGPLLPFLGALERGADLTPQRETFFSFVRRPLSLRTRFA